MKYQVLKFGLYSMAAIALMAGCKSSSKGGFETDPATGLQYHFFKQNSSSNKPNIGDIARVTMVGKTDKDSVVYNSVKRGGDSLGTFRIPLKNSFKGCLEQGIAMMSVGDSAEFKISADSLYLTAFRMHTLPPFIHPGSFMTFDIKLVSFETEKQANDERQQAMMKQMQEMQKRKQEEPAIIAKYLSDNKIKAKPSSDSLYFIAREGGKGGKAVKEGDSVTVTYKGMLLDGTVFDKSDHGPGHTTFSFLYTKDMQLIKGWIEAIGEMHQGEKATILLPSALAYGARQAGPSIAPYSPLLFDIEIVKVKSNKK